MNGATGTASGQWFLDETSILQELRLASERRGVPPAIPGYDDLREIQRGGQGVVYAGVQRSTRRRVAVKVLLDGAFASEASRRRFEREIDLVASLRHPNIVRVYDSGVTPPPDERVFLVMEFIEGVPLQEHVQRLDIPSQLRLFATICRAVGHAHQRGVIHRDLKPSNIRIDGEGQPHILDFGLAKVSSEHSKEHSMRGDVSIAGQFLGSLPWASPEQAEGALDRIDTRSDVYALGVVLYQALTGRFPYDVESGFREVLEHILRDDPLKPSQHNPQINDEVETIVLKCLAKDPDRRYQMAGDIANDLDRYLNGEPIDAKRDSMWYTMRKRLARYRLLSAAAAMLAMALMAGVATTAWQARRAETERIRADQERERAERRFDDVRAIAHAFIFDFHDQIEHLAGSRPAREMLVKTALQYLQDLSGESDVDPELQAELAAAWQQVGNIQGDPYQTNLGDTAGALESFRHALEIRQALADASPDDAERQRTLAGVLNQIGDVKQFMGDIKGSIASYESAMAALERVAPANPENAGIQRELAACAIKMGDSLSTFNDTTRAAEQYRRAMQVIRPLHEQDPSRVLDVLNLGAAHSKLGHVAVDQGDVEEALRQYDAERQLLDELLKSHPDNGTAKRNLSIAHNCLAAVLTSQKRADEALDHLNKSLIIANELATIDPNDVLAASDLAFTHNKMAELLHQENQVEAALEHYRAALELRQALAVKDPNNAATRRSLGTSYSMVGSALVSLAEDQSRPLPYRRELLTEATARYESSKAEFMDMRAKGLLSERDAGLPEVVDGYLANSHKALEALGN